MSPQKQQRLTNIHQWLTVYLLPACFGLLLYIAKGVYETGQQNAKDIVREHQVNEDQGRQLDRHEAKLVELNNWYVQKTLTDGHKQAAN